MKGDPLQNVEALNAMENLASLVRSFFNQLVEEGFDKKQALSLTETWLAALTGRPAEDES